MSVYLWKQKHFLSIFILHIKKPRKLSYKVAFLFTQPWWLLNYEQFKIQSIHEQCTTFCGKKGTLTWQSGLWYVCRMTEWSSTPEACYRTQPWRWCDPQTCSSWGGCCCSERTGWLCRWPCLLVMYWTEHTWGWRFPWIWWCTTLLASLQHLDPLHLLIQITININKKYSTSGKSIKILKKPIYIVNECTLKHNVESVLPFISGASEEFPEGILKHMLSPDMYSQVFSPHSLVQSL